MATDAEWLQTLGELPAADSARSEFFAAHPDLRNSRSVELLHEEVLRVLYADPIRAERMARVASWLSEDLAVTPHAQDRWVSIGIVDEWLRGYDHDARRGPHEPT